VYVTVDGGKRITMGSEDLDGYRQLYVVRGNEMHALWESNDREVTNIISFIPRACAPWWIVIAVAAAHFLHLRRGGLVYIYIWMSVPV
jgi:hypothetical protein